MTTINSSASLATSVEPSATISQPSVSKGEKQKLGWFFWVCVGWVALTIFLAIFANLLPLQNPIKQSTSTNVGPGLAHWLGTDGLGRDIFSRIIYGSRVSLVVGFASMAIALGIGGTLGMVSAYAGGKTDLFVNAASYVLLAFPALIALIALVTFWQPFKEWHLVVIIGIAASPLVYRVIRASTLSYATRDFVMAAKALGASGWRIITKELLPNVMPAIISFALIGIATIVVLEGTLAFLGLSVPPPTPSWGNMLNESRTGLNTIPGSSNPWLVIFPGLAMFFFLLALNMIGDRLREHFDVTEVKL